MVYRNLFLTFLFIFVSFRLDLLAIFYVSNNLKLSILDRSITAILVSKAEVLCAVKQVPQVTAFKAVICFIYSDSSDSIFPFRAVRVNLLCRY